MGNRKISLWLLFALSILMLAFLLSYACGKRGSNGDVHVPGDGLLGGDPSSPALASVFDYDSDDTVRDDEITTAPDGAIIARTKLEIGFSGEATVGEINALLESFSAKITSMLEKVNLIVVRIPDPGSLDALDSIIAQLEAKKNILHVNKAYMFLDNALPDNYNADTSDLTRINWL
jgi:hypothetical protein